MTRALPFTQARLQRALKVARKEGYEAIRVLPDGSIIIGRGAVVSDSRTDLDRELEEFEARHDAELKDYDGTD
jgi:hypothetical protein